MNTGSFKISGGDFARGGSASSNLKKLLKKINVEPEIIRRTMIAAYEAEMNVVIHARRGNLRFSLCSDRIDIEVIDEGPGIPDIDLAMKEGYSTAPPTARAMGFGAGMGLPNIKRNSDRFDIKSNIGEGTRVNISISIKAHDASTRERNSVEIFAGKCSGCLSCLAVCPTNALRVRRGKPTIMRHLCVDCGQCMAVCKPGALSMSASDRLPETFENTNIVLPPSLLIGIRGGLNPRRALSALEKLGFLNVMVTEAWEDALRASVIEYAREKSKSAPIFSPVCNAAINLIEVRFPSLLEHIAPYLSPIEAARRAFPESHAVYIATCPCQRTALDAVPYEARADVITPEILTQAILQIASYDRETSVEPGHNGHTAPVDAKASSRVLTVQGMRHVMSVLDAAENGFLSDMDVIELYACEGGCFGAPLLQENSFVARHRWHDARDELDAGAIPGAPPRRIVEAARRKSPFTPRAGVRLDSNISKAIEKLALMNELMGKLPGMDCRLCGAPLCAAHAEDIVMGRATINECVQLKGG